MERFNDNKGTSTKRTGSKGDNIYQDSGSDKGQYKDDNDNEGITPEILQPNPSSATPSFPTEIPARETK